MPNVTTGMNCVLQSLARTMNADDNIMFFNVTYGKCEIEFSEYNWYI